MSKDFLRIKSLFYRKLAFELRDLMHDSLEIVTNCMTTSDYVPLIQAEYKNNNKVISKLCDLLEIFADVNQELLHMEQDKLLKNKKSSRKKVSFPLFNFFRQVITLDRLLL